MSGDPYGRFLTCEEVMESTGLSRSQLYRAEKWRDNPLPRHFKIGTRSYWVEAEIVAWKEKLMAQREDDSG